jgi:hypothetical protein
MERQSEADRRSRQGLVSFQTDDSGGEHATEMLSYRRGKGHAYKILEHMYMNPNDPFQGHPSANSLFMVGQF